MKPTGQLKEEHGAVKVMLGILEGVCARMEAGRAVPVQHLELILEFLKVFVDTCHHAKEEDCLFPALEEAGVPREGGPIGVMLAEHEEGRARVRGMAAASRGYAAGEGGSAVVFAGHARAYVTLLLAHIDKEDNVLYPIADARLSEAQQAELAVAFGRIEEERVGQGRHEAFHKLLDRLDAEYGAA
jgi:hemerythrin-like domain-containing protein